jgi:hypothetical protein
MSIEIDKAGQIWIADYNNNKVNVYDSDFKFIKAITFKPLVYDFFRKLTLTKG